MTATRSYPSVEAFLSDVDLGGCVILDISLSGTDGLEVLRRLDDRGSHLAAIVLTAQADVRRAVAALRHGAVDVLEKTYNPDVLLAAVEKVFAAGPTFPRASSDACDASSVAFSRRPCLSSGIETDLAPEQARS